MPPVRKTKKPYALEDLPKIPGQWAWVVPTTASLALHVRGPITFAQPDGQLLEVEEDVDGKVMIGPDAKLVFVKDVDFARNFRVTDQAAAHDLHNAIAEAEA
jgi:hypothetical protein